MSWLNLLLKDVREHALAMLSLALGFVLVVFLSLKQQLSGAFSMSGFEVVRFSLITTIPLICFVLGNRLVVREFTGGTRKFVESLPISSYTPLLTKYLFGLFYILGLCAAVVLIVASITSAAEDIDRKYLQLLLIKSCAIGLLYWSIVFFVSLTGRIRLVLYVVLGLALMYLLNMPSFDETRFAPFALMDRQLFVFERELFPWRDLIETALIALVFVVAGFILALMNEGSIAEQLGKPISRRDMIAFALLGLGCVSVYTTLQKKWDTPTYTLSGEQVLRIDEPPIAISYLDESYRDNAQRVLDSLQTILVGFKADIGLSTLPQVQLALNTELERTEIEPELLDGVLLTANFADYNEFEYSMLNSIALHHLLLSLTNGRWDYETRHWLLDGFARWWAEGATQARASETNDELFARAAIVLQRWASDDNPLLAWQTLTDQHGFEGADALSYTAILYLEEVKGPETLIQLAASYINERVGSSSLEMINRVRLPDEQRFEQITGLNLEEFTRQWSAWLEVQAATPTIASMIASVPRISGEIKSVVDDRGVFRLEGRYSKLDGYVSNSEGQCVLRHQLTLAYELETMIYDRERDRQDCITEGIAHSIESPYAPGDRVYGLLEYESDRFNRPIPLWVGRIHVK